MAFFDEPESPGFSRGEYVKKELADTLRRNRTIDWQERSSARAKMRMLIKKLLKKHKYPPEGMEDAVQTVMTQCELWTDHQDMTGIRYEYEAEMPQAAENRATYDG